MNSYLWIMRILRQCCGVTKGQRVCACGAICCSDLLKMSCMRKKQPYHIPFRNMAQKLRKFPHLACVGFQACQYTKWKKTPWSINYFKCEVSKFCCISSMPEVSFLQILLTLVLFIHKMSLTKRLRA